MRRTPHAPTITRRPVEQPSRSARAAAEHSKALVRSAMSGAHRGALTPHQAIALQRTAGNVAVTRLLSGAAPGGSIQRRSREAERFAGRNDVRLLAIDRRSVAEYCADVTQPPQKRLGLLNAWNDRRPAIDVERINRPADLASWEERALAAHKRGARPDEGQGAPARQQPADILKHLEELNTYAEKVKPMQAHLGQLRNCGWDKLGWLEDNPRAWFGTNLNASLKREVLLRAAIADWQRAGMPEEGPLRLRINKQAELFHRSCELVAESFAGMLHAADQWLVRHAEASVIAGFPNLHPVVSGLLTDAVVFATILGGCLTLAAVLGGGPIVGLAVGGIALAAWGIPKLIREVVARQDVKADPSLVERYAGGDVLGERELGQEPGYLAKFKALVAERLGPVGEWITSGGFNIGDAATARNFTVGVTGAGGATALGFTLAGTSIVLGAYNVYCEIEADQDTYVVLQTLDEKQKENLAQVLIAVRKSGGKVPRVRADGRGVLVNEKPVAVGRQDLSALSEQEGDSGSVDVPEKIHGK